MAILGVYAPNIAAAKYLKPKLVELKKKIDKSTIIAEDLDTYLTNGKQKIIMGGTHLNSFYEASVTNENCRLITFINIDMNILIKH